MTKADIYVEYLREEGYLPKVDDDGWVLFKSEGLLYCIPSEEDDREFFQLFLPSIWSIESEDDRRRAYSAAVKVGTKIKVAKFVTVGDSVWVAAELLIDPIESFSKVFTRALRILRIAATQFESIVDEEE